MLRKNVKPKKTPIKGEASVKEVKKQAPCSVCGKSRPLANKTKKICVVCNKKIKLEALKERKAKKREKLKSIISQSKLDQMTSWLIRAGYEEKCYACGTQMSRKQLQCCHFVSRTKSMTRFDLRNLLPGCPTCNLYTPHHVWNLGKCINKIWGESTTEVLLDLSRFSLKLNNTDRSEIYELFKNSLDKIEQKTSQEEKEEIIKHTWKIYKTIIDKLTL